eukprot:NODE_2351_length_2230_cov_3.786971.p2 GENE.NODE_2351_length_2230_cov_3.786971~~NODE_2351_length_2230_cov_3.786971.p2  ORF type:complete len:321 (-),score=81.05 NODE_2351_length_2230_cov_3.786971:360-1322(-)
MLLTYFPASNVVFPVGTVVGERLLYLPSVGFCVVLLVGLHARFVVRNRTGEPVPTSTQLVGTSALRRGASHSVPGASRQAPVALADARRCVAGGMLTVLVLGILGFRTLLRVRDWSSADSLFLRDGGRQPHSAKTQFNLGITYMQQQDWEPAITALVRCAWADPLSALPFYRIGQIEIIRGRFESAESWLAAAVDKFGASLMVRDEEVFHDLALAMYQNGKVEPAERRLRLALRMNPDFAKGWNNLACCIAMHDVQSAMRASRKAVSLMPDNPTYLVNLAVLARHGGDAATAEAAWQRALMLFPGVPPPRDCTWEFAPAG